MEEHVPNPKPWEEWTIEDHTKFRMFSSFCPMCRYKWLYGRRAQLVETAQESENESVIASLTPHVAEITEELVELGLFIATSVDDANKEAGGAAHN